MTVAWTPPPLLQSHAPGEIWNALVSYCGTPIGLASKGVTALVDLAEPPQRAGIAALIEAASLRAVVVFDAFPFSSLFGADIETEDLECLPAALRDVLIDGMVATFWSLIPQNRISHYAILAVGDWCESAAEMGQTLDWLAISVEGLGPAPARLRVGCVAVDFARALAGGAFAARAASAGLKTRLTLEGFFTLGGMRVELARARSLVAGDVIVLAAVEADLCMVRVDRDLYVFRRSEDGWSYLRRSPLRQADGGTNMEAADMLEDDMQGDDLSETESGPNLSALMLDLDFDIGGTRIALATIETWQTGAIVELDPPSLADDLEVTIRVGGQAIAKGDLIRIDERLAVRLTRLLG